MRLGLSRSKSAVSLYVIKSTYINKKHSTKIVEKLGTYNDLKLKLNGQDPIEWAKEYIEELNRKEAEGQEPVVIAQYSPARRIEQGKSRLYNGGYLFLESLYHELGLHKICSAIQKRNKTEYDLNDILSRLLYTRVLYPGSKRSSCELAKRFIAQPKFELHQVYRALDVLGEESDFIQSELYRNSAKQSKRNTSVLYYDCTNFFFEIEQESGLKQYGVSKEHRPNPIVQMGLFMDGDGVPLAFSIQAGNTNEQQTLKPLEKKILSDFSLSKFVVCTDAGLASHANRAYNTQGERAFVVTQSLKTLPRPVQEWALEPMGWRARNDASVYDLSELPEDARGDRLLYKEQQITLGGLTQRMVVTYSAKYRDYQRALREKQIARALQTIEHNPGKLSKAKSTDYKRLIVQTHSTQDGEIAQQTTCALNRAVIDEEARFDGFYAVCTNLTDAAEEVIGVNQRRWEIEECFRIMKHEFRARPVYLQLDQRIKAHFLTCFLALALYRMLEKKLGSSYTCEDTISSLRDMMFSEIDGMGYAPVYARNDFTDALHEAFGFHTDYEIVTLKMFKNIQKMTMRK